MMRLAAIVGALTFALAGPSTPLQRKSAATAPRPRSPLAVVILLDLTRSSWWSYFDPELDGAFDSDFRKELLPDDIVVVGGIAASIGLPAALSKDPSALRNSVRAALATPESERYGNSPLWDGIDRAVALLAAAPAGLRRGILLVTDGQATGNVSRLDDVIGRARAAGVTIQVVFRPPRTEPIAQADSGQPFWKQPELALKRAAAETGGSFGVNRSDDSVGLRNAFLAMLNALR